MDGVEVRGGNRLGFSRRGTPGRTGKLPGMSRLCLPEATGEASGRVSRRNPERMVHAGPRRCLRQARRSCRVLPRGRTRAAPAARLCLRPARLRPSRHLKRRGKRPGSSRGRTLSGWCMRGQVVVCGRRGVVSGFSPEAGRGLPPQLRRQPQCRAHDAANNPPVSWACRCRGPCSHAQTRD